MQKKVVHLAFVRHALAEAKEAVKTAKAAVDESDRGKALTAAQVAQAAAATLAKTAEQDVRESAAVLYRGSDGKIKKPADGVQVKVSKAWPDPKSIEPELRAALFEWSLARCPDLLQVVWAKYKKVAELLGGPIQPTEGARVEIDSDLSRFLNTEEPEGE